jgi:hypothetical protein
MSHFLVPLCFVCCVFFAFESSMFCCFPYSLRFYWLSTTKAHCVCFLKHVLSLCAFLFVLVNWVICLYLALFTKYMSRLYLFLLGFQEMEDM